jgi:hypothetical protein
MAGMQSIEDLRSNVDSLDNGLSSGLFVREIIDDGMTKSFIIDANADEQLFEKGINSLGVSIMDYMPYAPLTIFIKEQKGQPTDRVTLRDEGDFESSFYLEVGDKQFEIKASDFKTEDLIKKYGRQILGLTDENITELIWQYIYPDLLNKTKNVLYGRKQ